MTEINARFVLHDGDLWMYCLGSEAYRGYSTIRRAVPLADGQPMTELRDGWWAADHEAAEITIRVPQRPRTVDYRLKDALAASERFPVSLTPEEYRERPESEVLWSLYEPVNEPQPDEIVPVAGPWVRLDGAPPPDDGRSWVADLPQALRNRSEYHHLLPGYMPGLRDRIKALAEQHRYKQFVFEDYQGRRGLSVMLQVPFDKPVTRYEPARNRNGDVSRSKKGRHVTVFARRELLLDVPKQVYGRNRAEAAAEWDKQVAKWAAVLDEASVAACSACMGHGHVITGSEQYEGKRS